MGETLKPETLRILVWAGIGDIVLGVGLAFALLLGFFGPDLEIAALIGLFVALWGVAIVVWGRNKLSQVEDRRGDLN
ncbi:MAG: hypothetical protein Q8O54_12545 [Brevundimonas sp.]|nr:hypothetical protein [Brevundimonas sp.]